MRRGRGRTTDTHVPLPRETTAQSVTARAEMRYASGMSSPRLRTGDRKLIQIVDAALADAARRSGEWLECRPGCTQCCVGVFAINQLDAARLLQGLAEVEKADPQRARRIRTRARASIERLSSEFPGNTETGVLAEGPEAEERFAEFANDEPCPVLDPETGLCDLYDARPMTCRTFGPPVRSEGGLGVCDLCYHGASDEQIAACEMVADPEDLESRLLRKLEKTRGVSGRTLVAFCVK
ncbi:MAG TPA: YkgJ family cysteine cluster protein [Candidatus Sulfotelmatobacter sp.]